MFASSFLNSAVRKSVTTLGRRQQPQQAFLHVEKRLEELNIVLPPAPGPKANYNIVCHASGGMLYISGHLPVQSDGTLLTGRIGGAEGRDVAYGYQAARQAGLNILSTLKAQLGDLDRVEHIVKVRTYGYLEYRKSCV